MDLNGAVGGKGPAPLMMGMVVVVVIAAGAVVPIVLDLIASSGADGTTMMALGMVPIFVAMLLLVAVARPLLDRMA